MAEYLTIGQLAQRTGLTTSTLRYYDELGLVPPARRVSGHRRYTADAVHVVGVVRLLQAVGFTLAESKRLLASRRRSPVAWRAFAARKSEELRQRIAQEEAAREAIEHSLACPADGLLDCPTFWQTVEGVRSGLDLAAAHAAGHAAADSGPGPANG